MKSEHLFIIRLGDGRHFEYEGTLDGAKRKASKRQPLGASREGFLSRAALRSNVRQYSIDM